MGHTSCSLRPRCFLSPHSLAITGSKFYTNRAMAPKKVCIVGSGNWGSAIAKLVGENTASHPDLFVEETPIWVFEEVVNGRKLTEIINTEHENVKYLPGRKLPVNVVAIPDISVAAQDADFLTFVLPHQFIGRACAPLKGKLKPSAQGLSLVKGFAIQPGGGIKLISELITAEMGLPVSVLMGANLANEVADEKFCETTIGSKDAEAGADLKLLFQTENFRVSVVSDTQIVEICGALKNIVACAAGFCDGLKCGDNTKAATIRLGLKEMMKYGEHFYPGGNPATYFESCGVADLITTCYGGRNRKVSEAFVSRKKSIAELEVEMLNGQKLQGPETAAEVNYMLKARGLEGDFPLFTTVHRICIGELQPEDLLTSLRNHPEHQ